MWPSGSRFGICESGCHCVCRKVVFTNDDGSGKFTQATLVHFEIEEAFKALGLAIHGVWVDPESSTSFNARYRFGERYLVFVYGGALLSKDYPVALGTPGKDGPKRVPPGIDRKNPPMFYSAPECAGMRIITPKTEDAVSKEVVYLRNSRGNSTSEQKHH